MPLTQGRVQEEAGFEGTGHRTLARRETQVLRRDRLRGQEPGQGLESLLLGFVRVQVYPQVDQEPAGGVPQDEED